MWYYLDNRGVKLYTTSLAFAHLRARFYGTDTVYTAQ